jgi:tetratricopeptide (TPR) repeat protein
MTGEQFGHYEVLGTLGSGGMGVVYLARDPRLDRRVAIKVLSDGRVGDDDSRARFRREAQALSRLNHPNIATVYDFDADGGRDFLVMEFIDGQSLRDVGLDPLPPEEIVRLGTQLAEALVAAHGAGVVHLDLKPGNLMRTSDGRLKVLDFGIARLYSIGAPDVTTETTPSTDTVTIANSAGTPPYMAPEQVAAAAVDGRTDVYGAGATLYELATGRRLFIEPRGVALYEAILRTPPDPPSRLNPAIGRELEATLLKALQKRPDARQQTAQELLADFQRCASAPGGRPRRRWTRREVLYTAAASAAAIGVTSYALWPVPARARFHARDFVLIGDFENHTDDKLLGRTVQEALTIALQQSQFVNLVSRERVADTLRRMQRPASSPVDEAAGLDICRRESIPALISGSVARSGTTTQITIKVLEAGAGSLLFAESAEYANPDQLFGRVDDLARRVRENFGESESGIAQFSRPLQKVTTGSLEALRQYSQAVDARAMGDFNAVERPLLAAIQLDPNFAMAHLKLGDYYMEIAGDDRKGLAQVDTAYGLRDRVTDREGHFIAAQYFGAHQKFEDARDSLKALTAIYPDDPDFRYELALAFYALEQLPPAINELRQAIKFNPHGVRAHGSLVLFLARDNQPSAALDAFREARAAGVDSPYLYWASGLARVAAMDVAGARADFESLARGGGYFLHLGRLQLARVLLFENRVEEAIGQLKDVTELARADGDANLELVSRLQLGHASLLNGDRAQARQQAAAIATLTSAESRPTQIRDAGTLALASGDRGLAERQFARLRHIEAAAPTNLVRAARLLLEGVLALQDQRFAAAEARLADSSALRPWYECHRYAAEACEAQQKWTAAADAWRAVQKARGQIVQDGFTPDLGLADTRVKRALARI